MAMDLQGQAGLRPVAEYDLVPKDFNSNEPFPFIEVDGVAIPRVWRKDVLHKRLVETAGVGCPSILRYDEQDQRVLWLYCRNEEVAYRFDPPYSKPCLYRLGNAVGMVHNLDSHGHKPYVNHHFYSIAGETTVFVTDGRGLYQLDGCSNTSATEIKGYATRYGEPLMDVTPASGTQIKALVGIAADLRIYQTFRESGDVEVVIERSGQETRRFASPPLMPHELDGTNDFPSARYIPTSNLVVWQRMLPSVYGSKVFYTLDLSTGKTRKSILP